MGKVAWASGLNGGPQWGIPRSTRHRHCHPQGMCSPEGEQGCTDIKWKQQGHTVGCASDHWKRTENRKGVLGYEQNRCLIHVCGSALNLIKSQIKVILGKTCNPYWNAKQWEDKSYWAWGVEEKWLECQSGSNYEAKQKSLDYWRLLNREAWGQLGFRTIRPAGLYQMVLNGT